MYGRLATEKDRDDLRWFQCSRLGHDFEVEVEEWINFHAWNWSEIDPARRLLVFEESAGGPLMAVSGHTPVPGLNGRFIPALGVAAARHDEGLGREVLYSVFLDAAEACPGGVLMWRVHADNEASHRMCRALGFTNYEEVEELDGMYEYAVILQPPS